MGLCLIATGWLEWSLWLAVLKGAVGLGLVIFVHELGHFAVAKMCGVKCEKFYLGFDIAGLKFCKFTWGETEYGIGILPLGGYVKMLGQEDNPARLREEIERAKLEQADDNTSDAKQPPSEEQPAAEEIDVEAAQRALYDPRSYLAQSVPKRMAIISAGVIMNLVFAFLIAVVAFKVGVPRNRCEVGQVMPGAAAWQVAMKPGDEILQVADKKIEKFRDMQQAVSLGDNLAEGLLIKVRRPGESMLRTFTVKPDSSGLIPLIGITNPLILTLSREQFATLPGTAAARAKPPFQLGDTIVKVDGTPIQRYAQLHTHLASHPDTRLKFTIRRPVVEKGGQDQKAVATEELTIDVAPNPMLRLGLEMTMGIVSAVQVDSPAAKAGIKAGDRIAKIDARPVGDPMTLPYRLQQRAGETITITIQRQTENGKKKKRTIDLEATLREPDGYETPVIKDDPVTADALGIAYHVYSRVQRVIDGSPAATKGLRAGDRIVQATIIPPEKAASSDPPFEQSEMTLKFDGQARNWPTLMSALQGSLPGTRVQLKWTRDKKEQEAILEPVAARDWFNPSRGLRLEPMTFLQKAETWSEAVRLGADETINATLLVYRFLQKLGSQQISPKALGGPIAIFTVAKRAAERGNTRLIMFLVLLSANLAVINFLPIPLLDGGHMVLLAWEGIRGKPADERVQLALTYIGLVFILSLMLWLIGLDVVRLIWGV